MIPLVLLAGAAIIGIGAVATFWNDIKKWIVRGAKKVAEVVRGVVIGFRIFVKKMREALQEISRHYSKDRLGNWEETTVTRKVPLNEVPQEIRDMATTSETDITNKLELELS
ncbi:hypothetical protein [Vibrio metschnikovii]|uniref:hypothetical protein n=1 Tax=Vibrio metschnikovii TaxID=28172 RepID=UPI001C2FD037|nr:hypothetical protein [Vibrio metschnikovii]EKO3611798.1 hypothetical protein [Vibrio metschnikovii]EKO3615425.1 hypothetical protein [Vibrio metschnikovii]EKO3636321.1 hypothetical protein [Vibrio metschnikovii]EKO3653378.1 hypothetical protein [Vibrio metschnikovii]EKO3684604.1 hypothetical protein [Vibrio metschnikovii]